MIDRILEVFTKPEIERSFIDNILMYVYIGAALLIVLILIVLIWSIVNKFIDLKDKLYDKKRRRQEQSTDDDKNTDN